MIQENVSRTSLREPQFEAMYARAGRPSITPEKLLRALLLQVLYTVRSERMLMEQLEYNLLFRWTNRVPANALRMVLFRRGHAWIRWQLLPDFLR